ncbi:MAG TPA: gluconate 2-dehydrogenase subunit 3 family protein [Gemmatimonadaceae bacterium]|jgi:gluconate 2-dehydrogenase gamma chain|nr:gluconate 2-dehydrogenase subunit 3 family protein [Gemmatimonadaceae bacterium]
MRRREFVIIPIGALGGSLLRSLAEPLDRIARVEVANALATLPLRFFTAAEARIVTAACERVFPRDEQGPGATDAGVVVYIDRQLAGPYGRDKYRYTKPPFGPSSAEHGYQGAENPRALYRNGIRQLGAFDTMPVTEQIAALKAIEKTPFFALLRAHTLEGMFCDPVHGGNENLSGWKMVGFPGPLMDYRAHVDAHYGEAWRPAPKSLEQVTGRRFAPWEEERG